MALAGMAPEEMRPTALVLNILVAGLGSLRFIRAGHFRWQSFWPFSVASVPAALIGGLSATSDDLYRRMLGVALCLVAFALLLPRQERESGRNPNLLAALSCGALIGYLSGLIGIGGGVFLSPLLILAGWATTKESLGISALFILVNSVSSLAGHLSSLSNLPSVTPWLAGAAFVGGIIGSGVASRWLVPHWLRKILVIVLLIAAAKLLMT